MIHHIVTEFDPAAGASQLPDQRARANARDVLVGVPVSKTGRLGFTDADPAKAIQYAKELAEDNPGKVYLLFTLASGFECPPGVVCEKTRNASGELVPAA